MPHTFDSLTALIANATFDQLIGERESEYLDAKSQPYHFAAGNHAKRELAKDITSFANAHGGYIIIGLTAVQDPVYPTEQITALNPCPKNFIDAKQYYDLIKEWIHPQPVGVTVTLHACAPDPDHVLGIITIPPQEQDAKPFLIAKTVDGNKTTDITFGYAERQRDTSPTRTVVELQHALHLGLSMERELLGRLDRIEQIIETYFQAQTHATSTQNAKQALGPRIAEISASEPVKDTPQLILSVTPIGNTSLRTMLSNSPTSIRQALANPTRIRRSGWGLYTGDIPRLVNGDYLRVATHGTIIHLYRDGTLLAAVRIDRNNLAWSDKTDRILHPLAMIEFVTNALLFFQTVLADLVVPPPEVFIKLDLAHLQHNGLPVQLPAGGIHGNFGFWGPRGDAPNSAWHTHLTVALPTYDPQRVAFLLARELYAWFGHTEEDIPYTEDIADERKISIARIQGMG